MPGSDAALVYGATSLMMTGAEGLGYRIEASADGTNWGNPAAVVTAVQSRLQDGSLAIVDSYENREASIYVRITASTFDGLSRGEAALVAETRKRGYNTFTWTPSASLATPTVFDVVYGSMAHNFDDLMETQNLLRVFVLTLTCLPFPRLNREIVAAAIAAPPATPTTVVVDSGAATTGWAGSPSAPSVVSGAVRESPTVVSVDNGDSTSGWSAQKDPASLNTSVSSANSIVSVSATTNSKVPGGYVGALRTGSVNLSGTPFVAIDELIAVGEFNRLTGFSVLVDGAPIPILGNNALGNGYYRLWIKPNVSSFASIEVRANFAAAFPEFPDLFSSEAARVSVDQIFRSNVGPDSGGLSLTRTGSIPTSATPYITVDYLNANVENLAFSLDGAQVTPLYNLDQGGGIMRAYLKSTGSTVGSVGISGVIPAARVLYGDVTQSFVSVDQVARTDTLPFAGTRRQLTRALPVAGSVRTQGRLSVQHESTALGETLVYVYANDGSSYTPPLRPYRTAGGTVTGDTSLYSGASDNLNTLVQFDIPANSLPAGNYRLMARLQRASTSTPTLTITANTRVGGINLPGGVTMNSAVTVNPTYAILDLGPMTLPTTALASASAGTVRITIEDVADTNVILDDAYLVNVDIGTVTIVDCGTGTPAAGGPSKRLWLDPATVTNNGKDSVLRGHTADRSDAFNPADSIRGWTPPQFEPPTMKVFTACNALDAAVELRHFPRFLHNAYAVA